MSDKFKAACVQMTTSDDVGSNVSVAEGLIRQARDAGAEFVLTPETTSLMARGRKASINGTFPQDEDPALIAFQGIAAELGLWLLVGSIAIKESEDRLVNRSFLLGPDGTIVATYDKIHMFDVDLASGERHQESRLYRPGDQAVVADLPWGSLGLTICYDLRFPYLYRSLAEGGADFLSVPSAFTAITGAAHWHVLLRARAIETGCFVMAPAQCGDHANGRRTYGHSLIVAPWGEVLGDCGDAGPGYVIAEIDTARIAEARGKIPSLEHTRQYGGPGSRPVPLRKTV